MHFKPRHFLSLEHLGIPKFTDPRLRPSRSNCSFEHKFQEGSERTHSKASLHSTRKAYKYQKFACAEHSECSIKNLIVSTKMLMSEFCFSNITIWNSVTNVFQNIFRLHVRNLQFCKSNCCGRAVQGQLSKRTRRNTATSSRTLAKSYRDLKGTGVFARRCFRKKLVWKISQNSSKRN